MAEIDFGLIFEASPTASVVLSPDLVFRAVNRAFERITGLDRAELIGRPELEVPAGPSGQGPPQLRASLERVLTERETDIVAMLRYDLEDVQAPGRFRERYWNTVNAPVLDPDGRLLWIVQKVHEITPSSISCAKRPGPRPSPAPRRCRCSRSKWSCSTGPGS